MRVAIIGHKQIPGRGGGIEVVVEELATRFVERGIDVVAYNRKVRGHSSPDEYRGVRLVDVITPNSKELNALIYSYLATIRAVADGADIIHYHALGPAASLWLAKLFGKRVVVTVHGLNYKTPKWKGFGARYIKLGERLTMARADAVIVLSRSIRKLFRDEYGRDALYVPNGLSMPYGSQDDSALDRFGLRGRDFVLCVSRLVPGKGLEVLLSSYASVATDAALVIAGDADHVDDFKAGLRACAKKDPRVVLTGMLNKDELAALYSAARLFVFPSEAEGMPMVLLEAMWYGCPCLVSDIPENTEVLEGHGETFRVCDEGDLREKLAVLTAAWPEREDTRSVIAEGHDWNRVADRTIEIYREVLR